MLLTRPSLATNFCPHGSKLQNSSTLFHATAILLPNSIPKLHSLVKPARPLLRYHYTLSPKPVFITTPIFYVNAVPHVGHLYSAVMADVLRRYYELKGYKAFLSTGTDEHGMKIQQAAAKSNEKPILFCDKVSQRFRELFEAADISYTTFIRTTEKRHATAVADFWKRLADNGHIYKGKHEGWYAVSDEAFYADSQVHEVVEEKTGEKYMASVESGQRVEWMAEENYKFRLSAFQGKLLEWLESNPQVIVPKNRFNEVHSWIKSDLSDLSVSRPRSRLDWGIPVPGDSDHTIYVWLDALINYMTVTGYPWTEGAQRPAEYGAWPADVHLVGKDIIRFHAIYWPAFLMAADLPLPRQIIAHSHWTMGKQKMSKSRGNVADPFEAMQKYGVDPIRYYLIRDGGITDDGDYSDGSITTRHRKDLAGQLGNLVSRSMADSLNPSGLVPRASEKLDMRDATLTDKLEKLSGIVDKYYEEREFNKAMQAVFDALAEANKHFTDNEPWYLVKDPQQSERLDTVLFFSVESTRLAGILLQPVMPTKMGLLLDRLGVGVTERTWADARFGAGWGGKNVNGGKRRMLGKMQGVLFPALKEKV